MSSNPKSASLASNPAAAASAAAAAAKKSGSSKDPNKPTKKKVRRKKPSSTPKGPTSAQIMAGGNRAQSEISSLKALEAARRKDPLWYRTSEVLQAISADSAPVPGLLNEQVELVENALKQNQLTRADVTPQAFGVLLEQARRYALELVADAQDCAYAAHRHDITRADLTMALELRPDDNRHTLGELQKMTLVSHNVNKTPLPPIPQECYSGIVLPPPPHQLTARTFDVLTGASVAQKMNQALPAVPASGKSKSSSNNPSYGASRGRQIPIQLNAASGSGGAAAGATGAGPMVTEVTSTTAPPTTSSGTGIKRKAGEL
mmetsp:Transcript_488/g.800  ORF Transcript_488/g.800 Transcript_488/m.800 type:complete len:318 (-) Transcript_488:105-1058(-)|eukprot:CAMPEP_0119023152 /NCGR_PEP_ID=MMETSP1176-20130426/29434_1 /TAXON_ID=265551 /ORGANISM="Synedropsis recta cf, Strain CCMP1620" /LENGTH=317 /DNA_ID=CAMNT_0006978159 /DNA_START=201 /DNA_END=1150 /DNA_ORIENTATION=-